MAAAPSTPSPTPNPSPSPSPSASPSAHPTPTPIGANIVLDVAAGGSSTKIAAAGSSFLANESMSLYWDSQSHVAGSVTTDSGGSFTKDVSPFPGDKPGVHRLCASVEPFPCANFTLQGPPTPTPAASPTPSPSPVSTATPSPTSSPSPSPVVLTSNSNGGGLDLIMKPPFVFLPIIGLLGLLAALAYWLLMRVDRTPAMPTASVVHRSARPDVGPLPAQPTAAQTPSPAAPVMHPPPAGLPPPPPPFEPDLPPDAPAAGSGTPEPPAY